MSNANLYAALEHSFAANAQRTALETPAGGRYSYADVDREVARYTAFLRSSDVNPGDRVAVQTDKSAQSLFLYLACLRAGLVYLPLNPAYQLSELTYFLSDAKPSLLVVRPAIEAQVRKQVQEQASVRGSLHLAKTGADRWRRRFAPCQPTALQPMCGLTTSLPSSIRRARQVAPKVPC